MEVSQLSADHEANPFPYPPNSAALGHGTVQLEMSDLCDLFAIEEASGPV